jgi:crossover junction endodeoxyribonuclease RuvC
MPDRAQAPSRPSLVPVLGIDPGLHRTGYAVLSFAQPPREAQLIEAGVIRLNRSSALPDRLVELENELTGLVETHQPVTLACEELYAHYKHPRTAILMAHARGVILTLAARASLRIIPVSATNVKKLISGSGRATKQQVQLAVTHALTLPQVPEPDDVADAIAIGLAGLKLGLADQAVSSAAPRSRA